MRIQNSIVASLILGSTLLSSILNANVYAYTNYYDTNIYLQQQGVSNPKHIVAPDSGNLTSWMPIWYLQQALSKAGFDNHWDGVTLNIQSSSQVDLSNLPSTRSIDTNSDLFAIAINGTTAEYAPKIVAQDPYSHIDTTYAPIYYVMEVLNRIGVSSDWDGTNWKMTSNTIELPENNAPVTKLSLAKDLVNNLQIPVDTSGTSPFDDVSASDWGYINAVSKYLPPDSLTHFGSQDPATKTMLDHAYQLYVGIPDNHMQYNAGGNTVDWATIIGLNNGISNSENLTGSDEIQATANLKALYYGYRKTANGYQLVVQPYDMYSSYVGMQNYNGASENFYTPSVIADDEKKSIQLLDDTTFTIDFSTKMPGALLPTPTFTFRLDGLSDKDTIGIVFLGYNDNRYSINGTSPWTTPSYAELDGSFFAMYDSFEPKNGGQDEAPSSVLAKGQYQATIGVKILENNNTDWYYIAHVGADGNNIGTLYRGTMPGSVPFEQGPDTPIIR